MAPACALDEAGLRLQLERYRHAGEGARILDQTQGRLEVDLDEHVDTALVEEIVAIERACCPFITLAWEPDRRRLTVSVTQPEHQPAIDAIAVALDLGGATPP
jgi:hypothetical protein